MAKRQEYPPQRLKALSVAFNAFLKDPIFTVHRGKKPLHPAGTPGVTWEQAVAMYKASKSVTGLGVKLGPVPGSDGVVLWAVDYDGKEKGPLPEGWPKSDTYYERSMSGGDRFHMVAVHKGEPLEAKKTGATEVYQDGRFMVLTGDRLNGAAILPVDPLPYYAALGVAEPKPYAAGAKLAALGLPGPVGESDLTPREQKFADRVRGTEDEDGDESRRDFKVVADLVDCGLSDAEIARILCALFWRPKLAKHKSYIALTIAEARARAPSPERIKAFREESRAIGESAPEVDNLSRIYTLEEMLAEFIYIIDGGLVVPRSDPRIALTFQEFEGWTAASVHRGGGKGRPPSIAQLWRKHPQRVAVNKRTFKAGAGLFCYDPDHFWSVNAYREPPRTPPPADWQQRVGPFLDHMGYLVPPEACCNLLLDRLAHIEQRPDVLPQVSTLMFTPVQGIGRNLMSFMLARVWRGAVGLDVNLSALLDGNFNWTLAGKTLVVVNEVREGTSANAYRHAGALRGLLTDEVRLVNPKYGRQYKEFNAARWLMFSNHDDALPLDEADRRVHVIRNPDEPRGGDYYAGLYAMACDPLFIASVREFLRRRDIGGFDPGLRAPLTEAKRQVVDASMSEADREMRDVVADHPSDCITSEALGARLFGADSQRKERASLRYVASRARVFQYAKKVRVRSTQTRVWVLRNHAKWLGAQPDAVAKEAERGERREAKSGSKF